MKNKERNIFIDIIFFLIPMLFVLIVSKVLDNDLWYLLSEGRYILNNGIYHIDPLSMHTGLNVVVQNWLSASLLWVVFSSLGGIGIYTLVLLCNFCIMYMVYKICDLISDHNRILSLIIMVLCDIALATVYIVSRPQIFSFIVLLSLIYVLELYIKTGNWKYLLFLPLFSIIEINMQASLWWMLFLFMLPYVIDSFKIKFLNTEGYKKKPLFLFIGISLLAGLINPYGYKAITFIFTSYGNKYMHDFIAELNSFSMGNPFCIIMLSIVILMLFIYYCYRKGNTRFRYICLQLGTMLLGFITVKAFSHFILVAFLPFAYYFKDVFPRELKKSRVKLNKIINISSKVIAVVGIIAVFILYVSKCNGDMMQSTLSPAFDTIDYMANYVNLENKNIYTSFNNGGYAEFRGYKPYIDPRAELFLKVNNKKADYMEEFYKLQHGQVEPNEFVHKYDFKVMIIDSFDIMALFDSEEYAVVYSDNTYMVKVLVKKDVFTKEQLKSLESQAKK